MRLFKIYLQIILFTVALSSCWSVQKPKQLVCIEEKQECYPSKWQGTPEDTSRSTYSGKPYIIRIREVEGINTAANENALSYISDNDFILQSRNDDSKLYIVNTLTAEEAVRGEAFENIKLPRAGAVSVVGNKIILAQTSNAKLIDQYKLNEQSEFIGNSRLYEGAIADKNISDLKKIDFDFNDSTRAWISQPALSPEADVMFLVMNKDMKLKGTDIYYSIYKDSKWTEPQNCGDIINTDCDELTPFVSMDGRYLYFASNGRDNVGGYDIFRISLPQDFFDNLKANPVSALNSLPQAKNLGMPVNSQFDEIFPSSPANPDSVLYFSSDRNGIAKAGSSGGGFDIFVRRILYPDDYVFESNRTNDFNLKNDRLRGQDLDLKTPVLNVPEEKLKKQFPRRKIPVIDFTLFKLKGTVQSSSEDKPVKGADVIATNKDKNEVYASTKTDDKGEYELYLEKNKDYRITAHGDKDFYDSYDVRIDTSDKRVEFQRDFVVNKQQVIRINFPYDQWDNPYEYVLDSLGRETNRTWHVELEILAKNILKNIDNIDHIVLTGHTDYIASNNYNIKLGKKRVDFVISELEKLGVPKKILKAYSKGESELLPERMNEDDELYRKRLRRVTLEKIMKRTK